MAIPLTKEPAEFYENLRVYENCVFCDTPSQHWHTRTNNCVCEKCAKQHKVSELTNWRKTAKKDNKHG